MTPDHDPTLTYPPDVTRTADGVNITRLIPGDGTRAGGPAASDTQPFVAGNDPAASDTPPGFVIEREVGRGGMGVVYLARQTGLNRPVALKLIQAGDSGSALRFLAEAEAMAAVRHPNVAEAYQFGEHHGLPFLALEYCPGGDLSAKLKAGTQGAKNRFHTAGRTSRRQRRFVLPCDSWEGKFTTSNVLKANAYASKLLVGHPVDRKRVRPLCVHYSIYLLWVPGIAPSEVQST